MKYKSGTCILEMNLMSVNDRKHYSFIVTIEGNKHYKFEGNDYSCPKNWSEEKIASDMFGWAIDSCCDGDYDIQEAVEYENTVGNHNNEDIVKVEICG